MNENAWMAKFTKHFGGAVDIRLCEEGEPTISFSMEDAAKLRDQLTAAIEEAKRQEDPFEVWWSGLHDCNAPGFPLKIVEGFSVPKKNARSIFMAGVEAGREMERGVTKAAKEGK